MYMSDIKVQNFVLQTKFTSKGGEPTKVEKDIIDIWLLTTYFTHLWENFTSRLCLTVEKVAVVFWSGLGFSQLWFYE